MFENILVLNLKRACYLSRFNNLQVASRVFEQNKSTVRKTVMLQGFACSSDC